MRTLTTVLLAFGLLSNAACQKDEINTVETAYKAIVGEWEWERSSGRPIGQEGPGEHTPASTGMTRHYVFRADRTVTWVINGGIMSGQHEYEYSIVRSGEEDGHELRLTLQNEQRHHSYSIMSFSRNTMVITDRVLSISDYYIRK